MLLFYFAHSDATILTVLLKVENIQVTVDAFECQITSSFKHLNTIPFFFILFFFYYYYIVK